MSVDAWLHFDVQGDLLASARECEAEVFLRWYGNTRSQLEDEYGPYDDASVFVAVVDPSDEVVATMRLLAPGGSAGLKALNDIGKEPWSVDPDRCASVAGLALPTTWEVATISSRRKSTTAVAHSYALYHGLVLTARANLLSSFVAVLDERVRRLLESVGLVTLPLPGTGSRPYLGSGSSTPVYAHGPQLLDNQRRLSPEAFALVSHGTGLDGIAVPPEETFRLHRRADLAPTAQSRALVSR